MTGAGFAGDRRVAIWRATTERSAVNEPVPTWALYATVWANLKDVSAAEKMRGREVQAEIDTRFTMRMSTTTRTLSATDRLVCEGQTYSVVASREKQRGRWIEVDAVRRADEAMEPAGS